MEYNFVQQPHGNDVTKDALDHRDSLLRGGEDWGEDEFPEADFSSGHKLTVEEEKLIEQYDQDWIEFTKTHHFFQEPITDDQRKSYIIGHRGGDEFPGLKGSVDYDTLASEILLKLRAGTYKRASGAAYSLSEFEGNVMAAYKESLKSGWLRNA